MPRRLFEKTAVLGEVRHQARGVLDEDLPYLIEKSYGLARLSHRDVAELLTAQPILKMPVVE